MKTTINSLLIVLFLAILIPSGDVLPQQYLERQFKGYTNPDELVTFSANASFNDAVALLSKVSESVTGKRIVSAVESDASIGIEMTNMPYDKALVILVQYHGLMYEEKEDIIVIKRKDDSFDRKPENYASVDSREIKISALFFEMDVSESRRRGVDWRVIFSKAGLDIGTELITEPRGQTLNVTPENFTVFPSHSGFDMGRGWTGQAEAMFRFFEEEDLGEIIASPNVSVRDRSKGRIQVGSDFAVKRVDFAGNIIETFFPTGTIIEVTPYVYKEDNVDYMLLDILAERSTFVIGEFATEIRKTNATTQVVMLDGEEIVLGGLFINEETMTRNGIPLLKDLPGWFFGLRYLFGSDSKVIRKKELVILLKAELVPTLKERVASVPSDNLLRDDIRKNKEKIRFYKLNQSN
jgi:type IV pilus assembly protein PilQ